MTTRLDLLAMLRRHLEDTAVPPLWDDTVLDDALVSGVRDYGARFPVERTLITTLAAGAITIAVPDLSRSGGRVTRVRDPHGDIVPRNWSDDAPDGQGPRQGWRWWDGVIWLEAPAIPGAWTVEYLETRTLPEGATVPVEVPEGDLSIVIAMASLYALHRRAVEDGKRGVQPSLVLSTAAAIRAGMDREIRARMRQARGSVLPAAS